MNISTVLLRIRPGIKWRPDLSLLLILCLALALRLFWLQTQCPIIENEGGEYAAIAENLLAGKGYVGQGLTGKPQLIFPPLYPLATAAIAALTHNTESAGRLLSVAMGVWLVFALFKLGTHFYGRSVGLLAAAMAAIHPLLLKSSVQVQTETMYFTFIVLGAYYTIKAVESHSVRHFLFAGALYGCAYLTRPEALLLLAVSAFFALSVGALDRKRQSVPLLGIAGMIAALSIGRFSIRHLSLQKYGSRSLRSEKQFELGYRNENAIRVERS